MTSNKLLVESPINQVWKFGAQSKTSLVVKKQLACCFCTDKLSWCPYIHIFDFL